jgi:hypothetical protein
MGSFDADGLAHWKRAQMPRWLRWNGRATPTQRRSIEALRVRVAPMARPKELPACVGSLAALRSISMPLSIASGLRAGSIPPAVEVLHFDETSGGRGVIAPELVFPAVAILSALMGELRFARASFPALRDVRLKLGPRSPMPGVLASYRSLDAVHVGPIRAASELASLVGARIRTLGIAPGTLASLDGLERLTSLETIWLKNLPKLRDLSALSALPKLRSVEIQYCHALEDLYPLLAIPKLARLRIVGCQRIRLAAVADALIAKRYEQLAITGKRHLHPDGAGGWARKTR